MVFCIVMAAWVTIDEAVNLTRNPVCDVDFHFRPAKDNRLKGFSAGFNIAER